MMGSNLQSPARSDVKIESNRTLANAVARAAKKTGAEQRKNEARVDPRILIRKALIESDQSDPNGFERIIGESDLTSINFLDRGRRAADAVCRIRIPGEGGGWTATGFLVGPRLLITNNHVLSSALEAGQAECEFGYEHDREGALKPAIQFNLAPNEIFFTDVAHDVTFVAIAAFSDSGIPIRRFGFLPLIPLSGKAVEGEWVSIVQHPAGQPKQIAIRANRVVELRASDAPGTDLARMIHYTTDTEPGSSGSPVLNDQWQVVALHHKAVPAPGSPTNGTAASNAAVTWLANEGVRVSAIYHCLEEQRFTNPGAAAALAQLERGLGVAPVVPTEATSAGLEEADRAPLAAKEWTALTKKKRLGYDPDFLSTSLPLDKMVGRQKGKAARLIGLDAIALDYLHFSVVINAERKFPMITAVNIHGAKLKHPGARNGTWRRDIRMSEEFQPAGNFYEVAKGNDVVQFSRGHLVRRLDPCWGDTVTESKLAEMHTFHYSNASPQVQRFNDVEWGNLEDYVLDRIQTKEKKLTVLTGPIFRRNDPFYGRDRDGGPWRIPVSYWKIAVIQKTDSTIAAAAFIIGQTQYVQSLYEAKVFTRLSPYSLSDLQTQKLQTTIETIEKETGLNFSALRRFDSATALESTRQTRLFSSAADIII